MNRTHSDIGIIGTGRMGVRLAAMFARAGRTVTLGSRSLRRATYIADALDIPGLKAGTYADAVEETGRFARAALDGGPCDVGLESTVVAVLDEVRLLRPGAVTRAQIEAVVGPLAEAEDHASRSPGRLALHYAPDAPVRLNADGPRPGEAYLAFGGGQGPFNLSPSRDLREAAANLFRMLREADRTHPTGIAVAPIPAEGLGEAINDRLKRAAGFVG